MQTLGTQEARPASLETSEYAYPFGKPARRQTQRTLQAKQATTGSHTCNERHAIVKRGRFWNVIDPFGALVCVTVYKSGAREVIRRLESKALDSSTAQR